MRQDRSALVGVLLGVLLLAGVAGFAIGLPEVVGNADEPEQLPVADQLPPSLVSGSLVPLGEAVPQLEALSADEERKTADRLTDLFDAEAVVRYYSTPNLDQLASVTILERPAGLFQPAAAEKAGTSEMVRYGNVVCSIRWGGEEQLVEAGGVPRWCSVSGGTTTAPSRSTRPGSPPTRPRPRSTTSSATPSRPRPSDLDRGPLSQDQ